MMVNRSKLYQKALTMVMLGDRHGFVGILRYLRFLGDTDGARLVRAIGTRLGEYR